MQTDGTGAELDVEVSIVDILDYVGESVRPIREGHAVFAANHIVCIGFRQYDASSVDAVAYVNQTSHPGHAPHKLELKIFPDVEKWSLKCSCKAGTAKCKHIIACLLHLERYGKLEYLSCTDEAQAWGISKAHKTSSWGAKRIKDLCCVKKPKQIETIENDLETQILTESFSRIISVSKDLAIFKHMNGRFMNDLKVYPDRALQANGLHTSDPYCSADELTVLLANSQNNIDIQHIEFSTEEDMEYFDKHLKGDIEKSVAVAIDTRNQNTNNWKIHRSIRITASSCYKLHTYLSNKNL